MIANEDPYQHMRRMLERTLSFGGMVWGLILIFDGESASAPLYRFMNGIAQMHEWGIMFACVGLARLALLMINGRLPWGRRARWVLSFVALQAWWMPLVVSFWWYAVDSWVGHHGIALPGLMLAPIAFVVELQCFRCLSAELATPKPQEAVSE